MEQRIEALLPYRRALRSDDRPAFDAMMRALRERRAAGGMLVAEEPMQVMLLSVVLGAYRRIEDLERRLSILQTSLEDAG